MIYFDFPPSFEHCLLLFRKFHLIAHLCFNGARIWRKNIFKTIFQSNMNYTQVLFIHYIENVLHKRPPGVQPANN